MTAEEVLTRRLPAVLPGYEPRPAQLEMAAAVADALRDRHPLLCEAGTGTGKTLAYLVPALLSGLRVVVSTGTRHLQEQIYHKDLPILRAALPTPFSAVRLKGIANYLCLRRLELALSGARDLFGATDPALGAFADWRERSETGDRAELLDLDDDDPTWQRISATSETRLGGRCPHFERCFVTRARRAAQEAQLVIVNHHLLCADLAMRARWPEARLLPDYDALICDEAHGLEEVATDYFGVAVSGARVLALLRDLRLLTPPLSAPALGAAEGAWTRLLLEIRRRLPPLLGEGTRQPLHGEHLTGEPSAAALDLDSALLSLQDACAGREGEVPRQLARRAAALRDDLALILDGAGRPGGRHVHWLEQGGGGALHAAPVAVDGILREQLYASCPAVVLTSATLAPGGRFDFARQRLGLDGDDRVAELRLASPFDYARQAVLYLPDDLPEPGEPTFLPAACERMRALIALTGGRAFLLFTSTRRMQAAYARLRPDLFRYLVLRQGEAPKHHLVARFAAAPHGAVLFATASFWEGVDVIGPALQLVVIDKLPFAPPDDPLLAARCRRLEEEGQDAFAAYQVPRAALLLAQGFGRLIRHRDDRGIVALLDRRAAQRGYGPKVLSGLPQDLPRVARFDEVARLYAQAVAAGPGAAPSGGV